ncbi:HAD family hydrolase [Vagococcus elongatus]|uniref:Pesticidal protein Cry10Aa n=1 Tax=Vagococcus elongatus TaxID=180344 RepID=A0A430AM76_9ENTE|nr:HAD family phosphatase [Vagococcus elongatus]RSU09014.1 hypothetical protein CBF29_12445 [Vagococcus elongatus]
MQSIIFDFNGTLFSDSHLHEQAWQQFIQELIGRKFTPEEFDHIHGRTNHLVMEKILGKSLSDAEGEKLSNRKEAIYRDLVLEDKNPKLIKGVTEYFDFLKDKKCPMNIATVSPKVNVDFYFDIFQLGRWFDYEHVVYNDGTLKSKPAPDFYIQAALNIGGNLDRMIVFEDSPIGLQGAANAKAEHIIAVSTEGNHQKLEDTGLVDFVIDDFLDVRIKEIIR